jgi:hypothetical protein
MSTAQVAIPITNNSDPAGANATQQQQSAVFIENKGQWDMRAKYLLRTAGLDMWVTDHGVVYDLYRMKSISGAKSPLPSLLGSGSSVKELHRSDIESQQRVGHAVEMNFIGTSTASDAHGTDLQPGYYNYFLGNDKAKWASNVGLYAGARIKRLYDGVDAIFYLDGGKPRYDLVVAPGASLADVGMRFTGSNSVRVGADGSLVIATSVGEMKQQGLFAYQMVGSERQQVRCNFVRGSGNVVRFDVGSYDRSRPLVIDPLIYSTYLTGGVYTYARGIAIDGSGNAYVTGYTASANFPTSGAYQSSYGGGGDVFITKLSSSGNALAYSTFLGGSAGDEGYDITVDGSGNAYVLCTTGSADLPTVNAFQSTYAGEIDAFVAKLSSSGNTLLYSTYLGGTGTDQPSGIAVDGNGNAYLTGYTRSIDFPTVNAYQSSRHSDYDVFVSKLNNSGNTLLYSTYLGGSNEDIGYGITIDGSGNAYITGNTFSADFPMSNPYQSSNAGNGDAFITKLNSNGNSLLYSTYLGGTGTDGATGIAIDLSGNAYATGNTTSTNFPTLNAYQSAKAGTRDMFITKLNSSGGSIVYSTYLGGSSGGDYEFGYGIAVDANGSSFVTGLTQSTDFPMVNAFQPSKPGPYYDFDIFVSRLSSNGSSLVYSSYLGGSGPDVAHSIAIDGSGNAYLTGYTLSANFPTLNPFQSAYDNSYDAFITKLSTNGSVTIISPNGSEAWCAGSTHAITWTSSGIANMSIDISSNNGSTWSTIVTNTPAATGLYTWNIPPNQILGSNYRIRLSDVADSAVNDVSDNVFAIATPSVVTNHPDDTIVIAGTKVKFKAAATNYVNVQWQRSLDDGDTWTNIIGETGLQYKFTATMSENGQLFRALFDNGSCQKATDEALLTVKVNATDFGPALVWIGTINAADNGRRIDVTVEIYKNGTRICSGERTNRRVAGTTEASSRRFRVPLTMDNGAVAFGANDVLSTKVFVKRNGGPTDFDVKIWYNDAATGATHGNSRYQAGVDGSPVKFYYLCAAGTLSRNPGSTGLSSQVTATGSYTSFGTWSTTGSLMKPTSELAAGDKEISVRVVPNPMTTEGAIVYSIESPGWVTINITNSLGEAVVTLVDDIQEAGEQRAAWNGRDSRGSLVPSGTYFYHIESGSRSATGEIVVVR